MVLNINAPRRLINEESFCFVFSAECLESQSLLRVLGPALKQGAHVYKEWVCLVADCLARCQGCFGETSIAFSVQVNLGLHSESIVVNLAQGTNFFSSKCRVWGAQVHKPARPF